MSTTTAQRTGIWIITIVLAVGTIAGFVAMILAPNNQQADAAKLQRLQATYQKDSEAYQAAAQAQQDELDKQKDSLSKQYAADVLGAKKSTVAKFNSGDAQKDLVVKDLKKGTGEEITDDTTYAAYYIGWLSSGKIFDSRVDGDKLKSPAIFRPGSAIPGWMSGIKGAKIGGIRVLTIPSKQAYGASEQGDIPANAPLKFIIMPIKKLETLKQPQIPQELIDAYSQQQQ